MLALTNFRGVLSQQKRIPANAADQKNFFSHPFWKHFFWLMKCVPVKRNIKDLASLNEQVKVYQEVLKRHNLILFVEGTRSRNGKIGECRSGPAKLVILEYPGVQFVPVYLEGVEKIMPVKEGKIFTRLSLFHKARIVFGLPIDFSDVLNQKDPEASKIQLIRNRIRAAIEQL